MAAQTSDFDQIFIDPEAIDVSLGDLLDDVSWTPDSNGKPDEPRDRPLDFHWKTDRAAIEHTGWKESGTRDYDRCVRSMMTAVALAGQAGDAGWVSYSRRWKYYVGKDKYQGIPYTYTWITRAVEELKGLGLIEEIREKPRRPDDRPRKDSSKKVSRQSRIRATQRLLDAFAGATFEYQPIEIIRLRNGDGDLMPYRETAFTRQKRAELEEINAGFSKFTLTLPAECVPVGDHHVRVGDSIIRTTPVVSLYRVFNRGKWGKGGRAYWWGQSLPSKVREKVLIDGEEVVEEDYASLHPRLCYALAGVPMAPGFKPYAVEDVEPRHAKFALLIGINASNRAETIGAMIAMFRKKFGDDLTRAEAAGILDAVIEHNPAISSYFCSDAGIDLMRIDSELAIRVVKACLVAGFPAFPIHDSFIVPRSRQDELLAIMDREIEAIEESLLAEKNMGHNTLKSQANSSWPTTDGEGASVSSFPASGYSSAPSSPEVVTPVARLSCAEIETVVSVANRYAFARAMAFARSRPGYGPCSKVIVPRIVNWSKRSSWKVPRRGEITVDVQESLKRQAAAGKSGRCIPALGVMEASVADWWRNIGEGGDLVVRSHDELCRLYSEAENLDWIAHVLPSFEERVAGRLLRDAA